MNGLGRFDYAYKGCTSRDDVRIYGSDEISYRKAYEWLQHCDFIADFGCGFGFFRTLCKPGQYWGLDSSCTPHADEHVDLVTYRGQFPGVMLRHCLEHNEHWADILRNALASFTERMALVLFTPWSDGATYDMEPAESGPAHRCLSFRKEDILLILDNALVKWRLEENIPTATEFGLEHIFYIER